MTALAIIQLILMLGKGILTAAGAAGWPQVVLDAIQAGLNSFQQVQDTLVTKDQLEALRVDPNWQ